VLTGLCAMTAIVALSLVLAAALLGYLPGRPPAALRVALLAGVCVAWAAGGVWFLLRSLFWRQNRAQTARFVEQQFPDLRNQLINPILLASDDRQASPEFVQRAIFEAADSSRGVDLRRAVSSRPLKRWAAAAAGSLVLLAAFATLQAAAFSRGLKAVFQPGAYVPARNTIELIDLTPGDAEIFSGESVVVSARIANPRETAHPAELIVEGQPPRPMFSKDGYRTYTCPLGQVSGPLHYQVRIGDSRWPADREWYAISVHSVAGMSLSFDYPRYTGLEDRTLDRPELDGGFEAPVGSKVTVTVRLSAPLPGALLERPGEAGQEMARTDLGRTFSAVLPVTEDGGYRILLRNARGETIQTLPAPEHAASGYGRSLPPGYFRVRAVSDDPPRVRFLAPARPVTIAPNATLEMRVHVSDRYGLTGARLWAGIEGEPPQPVTGFPVEPIGDRKDVTLDYVFLLAGYTEGTVLEYYATATDNRNLPGVGGPRTASSRKYKITVMDPQKVAAEKARAYEELRRRLLAILRMQEPQRVNTEICRGKHQFPGELKAIHKTAREIHAEQQKIRAAMVDLVENFPFNEDLAPVRPELATLANNEARTAIDQARVLSRLTEEEDRDSACVQLAVTQNRIIDALQTLLAMLPSMAGRPDAKKTPEGGDLPGEVREKLAGLKDNMRKFIDEQRKVIQASERLSKKPVDDFTEADEKLLKELTAVQDQWEKFLNEQFTDFSKLAEQDFSNPAMLKELISVKSDVTMAADALRKKAVEIATAVEDNGIENAESLTANIEKWLPDEPDRKKWAMEDPADGQTNPEQAELPTELEDLVGDLLEEEEDLFEEMEDLSSKYAMSGDKGIGWGAMDGPISNMNAQGVTGNQLPNTNEMQGRSGEGRTGKSSGEFVEDKAVGKGGRRTPTRLTPEPFSKGQVDDVSQDPAGGATGGGKLSGSGQEGLEGPVPPELQKELGRLTGKQAALINRAERIQANFKVTDHANFKLLKAITLMNRVRGDLEAHRYQNVLRSKDSTLSSLRQTKMLLAGQIDVTADTSSGLPKYVRDDIADAMKGNLPEQYKDVLEQYYKRLGEQSAGE